MKVSEAAAQLAGQILSGVVRPGKSMLSRMPHASGQEVCEAFHQTENPCCVVGLLNQMVTGDSCKNVVKNWRELATVNDFGSVKDLHSFLLEKVQTK